MNLSFIKKTKNYGVRFLSILALIFVSSAYMGCDEDETIINPPNADTTVAIYNNLVISERTIPFDDAFSGVDLFFGQVIKDSSRYKDANLVDSISFGDSVYYFRSGDLSDLSVPGYQTRWKLISLISTQGEFDTMKVIPDSDTTLSENDFTSDISGSFRAPLTFNSVFGFYLKGKYDSGVTANRVFGMLYLEQTYYEGVFKLRFDVKINKLGQNRFASQ